MGAIIYLAHGSRRAAANEKFISFIKKVMKESTAPIQAYGFLEHAEPSFTQAIETCIAQGASEVTVVPVFLLPGIHANVDIPIECKSYPEVLFHYGKPLGVDGIMVEILSERLAAAGFAMGEDEAVLLVTHGSREPSATSLFEKLATGLSEKGKHPVHTASLTTPVFYHEMAETFLAQHYEKVFILPSILFSGGYTVKMEKVLSGLTRKVVLCEPVGFDEKLIPLIEKRAREARERDCTVSDYVTA